VLLLFFVSAFFNIFSLRKAQKSGTTERSCVSHLINQCRCS